MFIKKIDGKKYFDLYAALEKVEKEKKVFVKECKKTITDMDDNNNFSIRDMNLSLRKIGPFENKIRNLDKVIFLCHEMDKK